MNYELGIRNQGLWRRRLLIASLILNSYFLIPPLARAAEPPLPPLNVLCFQKQECEGEPYRGVADESQAAECRAQDKRWVAQGFTYNCYAKQPEVTLQIPLTIGQGKITGIGNYIRALYTYLVGITAIAAGIMIIWAGVRWLTSAGNPEHITDAKHKIGNAVIGLFLVLGSYVILQTVNPALINLRLPQVKQPRQQRTDAGTCVNRAPYYCGGAILRQPLSQSGLGILATESGYFTGKYPCDKASYIENPPCVGGIQSGECLGQYCPFPGCYTLLKDRIRPEALEKLERLPGPGSFDEPDVESQTYTAFQAVGVAYHPDDRPGEVARDVQNLLELAGKQQRMCVQADQCGGCSDTTPWAVCISSACNCTLGVREIGPNAGKVVCMPLVSGSSEFNALFGSGASCSADIQCQPVPPRTTGVCNFGPVLANVCGPSTDTSLCNRDIECGSSICNTEEAPNRCRSTGWGVPGAECDRATLCQSGRCGPDRECTNMDGSEYD